MFQIKQFTETMETEWDAFVMQKSVNGTFLQTRRFLNYHPAGRFQDCSLMIYDSKNNLVAVIPACAIDEPEGKTFFSHKGSTFGGIVICEKYYRAKYVMPLIDELMDYWKEWGYRKICLKNTSRIFAIRNMDLMSYALRYHGFSNYIELSSYVDFGMYAEDILSNFSQGKRTNIHNGEREGLLVRSFSSPAEIAVFYDILIDTLAKYNVKPVHTLEELLYLKNECLQNESEFFGCYHGDEMIAGGFMFYFQKANIAHTQYLAAKEAYSKLSPMTYLNYGIIKEMKTRGFNGVSWGIATERQGSYLNEGLITSKENYGSEYCNNITYTYTIKE